MDLRRQQPLSTIHMPRVLWTSRFWGSCKISENNSKRAPLPKGKSGQAYLFRTSLTNQNPIIPADPPQFPHFSLHHSSVIDRRRVEAYVRRKGVSRHDHRRHEETADDRDKRATKVRTRIPDPPTRVRTVRGTRQGGRPRARRLAPRRKGHHKQEISNRHRLIYAHIQTENNTRPGPIRGFFHA